jgi:hypothetical protein
MPSRWGAAWAFVAVALAACTSGSGSDDPPPAAVASSQVTPTERVEIDGIVIDEPDWKASGANWRLRVSWDEPDGIALDHYEVRRDGVTVDREIEATVFVDDDVEPGARYRYRVVGVDREGVETRAATVSITTDRPRLSEARLQGTFTVRMAVERASGTNDPVRGGAIFFTFDPRCRSGACDVRWTVRGARTRGTLLRADAVYTAMLRTPLFVRNCFGDVIDETVDVRLRVSGAAPVRGRWRATTFEGSIDEVSSYGGCMTATIDWGVRGSLQA